MFQLLKIFIRMLLCSLLLSTKDSVTGGRRKFPVRGLRVTKQQERTLQFGIKTNGFKQTRKWSRKFALTWYLSKKWIKMYII